MNARECPNRANHHPDYPTGYLEQSVWAARMSETHIQEQCPGCGLWLIWRQPHIAATKQEASDD